ncbi:MAG TPA: UvrD-helicase domain-containing protein [Dehalococcoidales bacterium]|nr:UvrD-helicase domain-containing protein [Dehalococcoidales bacterium]
MDILAQLNPAQKAAVEAINGPVLILAGPGSGKTRVITHRVAYLIKVCGINPHHILAVTFTNKAAKEMADRLQNLAGSAVQYLTIGTFHAICARILRIDGKTAGIEPDFIIYDEDDQMDLVKKALQEFKLDPKQMVPRAILSAISASKSRMQSPQYYASASRSYFDEVVGRVYERYQRLLDESHALDFDDLLMRTVELFRNHPDILKKYQNRYVHVMVDEFQDTNLTQYELVKLLAAKHRNICVVGDPDQSIYSWRQADVRNILNFEKDYPDARTIMLEQNYRSTRNILETATHVIKANRHRKDKTLWTDNTAGELTSIVETYTEQEEAQFVVKEIDRLVNAGEVQYGDCAVMFRTNAQSRVIEEAFVRYGLPYKLVAGTRFYERREIKDLVAYLRLIQNPLDSVSLLRIINIPGRGIGQATLDQLSAWAGRLGVPLFNALQKLAKPAPADNPPPFNSRVTKALVSFITILQELIEQHQTLGLLEFFDAVVIRSGYKAYILNEEDGDERFDNIQELRTVAEQYQNNPHSEALSLFLESVALVSDVDDLESVPNKVTLITLHQAKGLEFKVVFIVGVEEGLLPHFRSLEDPAQMEEERRLCYVGITRAMQKIYLVHSFRRSLMGRSTVNEISRFMKDIPQNLIAGRDIWQAEQAVLGSGFASAQAGAARPPAPQVQIEEFRAGEKVRHGIFGEGIVVSSTLKNNDREVVVAFSGQGVKKLMASFAKLQKIN